MRTNAKDVQTWTILERLLMPANALAVETMLRTGLRVSDVLSLRTSDLKSRFTVKESKTGKSKRIYLGGDLLRKLRAQAGEVFVFEGAKGVNTHRTRQAVWADIKRAAKAMRLSGVVAPHSARKSYAVDEYTKCHDIRAVQRKLNHDRIETTVLYLLDHFGGLGGS